jgi:hypothetical protein
MTKLLRSPAARTWAFTALNCALVLAIGCAAIARVGGAS